MLMTRANLACFSVTLCEEQRGGLMIACLFRPAETMIRRLLCGL